MEGSVSSFEATRKQYSAAKVGDQPLRRDVRMLGFELGRVIKHHGDPGTYDLIEHIRQLAKRRRAGDTKADEALRRTIIELTPDQMESCIRALSSFFDLANLAEDRHRVRVLRQREQALYPAQRGESIGAAIEALHARGLPAERVQQLLNQLDIELVFTAHPTEAKRRTVRNTLRRLREDLIEIDRREMLPRERDWLLTRIKADLACLWDTDALTAAPANGDRRGAPKSVRLRFGMADHAVAVARAAQALRRVYPGHRFEVPTFLRFGSWIGGDRDGNPYVTSDVTCETLMILRATALRKHLEQCDWLWSILTISEVHHPLAPALAEALEAAQSAGRRCSSASSR